MNKPLMQSRFGSKYQENHDRIFKKTAVCSAGCGKKVSLEKRDCIWFVNLKGLDRCHCCDECACKPKE